MIFFGAQVCNQLRNPSRTYSCGSPIATPSLPGRPLPVGEGTVRKVAATGIADARSGIIEKNRVRKRTLPLQKYRENVNKMFVDLNSV